MIGIIYYPNSIPKIIFVVKRYFSDLITAFKKYESRVKNEEKLVKNVELALNSIGSKLPRSRPLFRYIVVVVVIIYRSLPVKMIKPTSSSFILYDDLTDNAEFVGLDTYPQFFTHSILFRFSILRHLKAFGVKITIIGLFEIQD